MLMAIGGLKGSPGATTAALAITASWPRPALLVEADPVGTLIYRLRDAAGMLLSPRHTVLQIATEASGPLTPQPLHQHIQIADGDLRVLLGTTDPAHMPLTARAWPYLAPLLARLPGPDGQALDVIADLGRWQEHPAQIELTRAASIVLTVAWPGTEALAQLRDRTRILAQWRGAPIPLALALRTRSRDAKRAFAQTQQDLRQLQIPADLLGVLAEDPNAPQLVGAKLEGELAVSARQLAAALAARPALPPSGTPTARLEQSRSR